MNSWVGQTLGKVRIDVLLARDEMAKVYIGTHTTLHKVAVKVSRNNYDEHPNALERFKREAMVVGRFAAISPNAERTERVKKNPPKRVSSTRAFSV